MKLSERMYNAKPKKSHDMGDVFFYHDVDGWADEVVKLEAEVERLQKGILDIADKTDAHGHVGVRSECSALLTGVGC